MQAIRGRNRRYRGRRVPIQRTLRDFSDSPLCKLSRDLVSTYQTINNRYFETVQSNEDDRSNSYGNIAGEYEADSGRRQIMSIYNLENQERTLKNDHVPILDRYDFSFTQRVRGTIIGGRFRLEKFLGKGSFGIVVSATDLKTNTMVAIKMIKKHEHFSKLAQKELEVLQHISSLPEYDRKHIGNRYHFLQFRVSV